MNPHNIFNIGLFPQTVIIFTARKRSLQRLCFCTCLSVILFTGGSTWAGTPLGRYTPWAGTPPGRYTSPQAGTHTPLGRYTPLAGTPPRQVHPQAGTPPGRYTPLGRYTPGQVHPQQCMLGYGQQAGGTYPTGMHSCLKGRHL